MKRISMEHAAITIPVLTPDGDLILTGGIPCNNYKLLSSVGPYPGFSNEASFFRNFKAVTGMTPREWESFL